MVHITDTATKERGLNFSVPEKVDLFSHFRKAVIRSGAFVYDKKTFFLLKMENMLFLFLGPCKCVAASSRMPNNCFGIQRS